MTESSSKILLISRQNIAADALYATSLSFKRSVFRTFKNRIKTMKTVSKFTTKQAGKVKSRLLLKIFSAWKEGIELKYKSQMVTNVIHRKHLLSSTFKKWRIQADLVVKSAEIVRYYLNLRARKWIKILRTLTRKKKKKIIQKQRKKALALCVLVQRMFFAWKILTERSHLNPQEEAQGTFRAVLFIKGRIFREWSLLTAKNVIQKEKTCRGIEGVLGVRRKKEHFRQWCITKKCLNYSYYSTCEKGFSAIFNHSKKGQKERETMTKAVLHYAAYVTLEAVRLLKIYAMKRKRARTAALVVESRVKKRLCSRMWGEWRRVHKRHVKEYSQRTFLTLDSKNISRGNDIFTDSQEDREVDKGSDRQGNREGDIGSGRCGRGEEGVELLSNSERSSPPLLGYSDETESNRVVKGRKRGNKMRSSKSIAQGRGSDVSNGTDSWRIEDKDRVGDRDCNRVGDRDRSKTTTRRKYFDIINQESVEEDDEEDEDVDDIVASNHILDMPYRLCLVRAMRRWRCTALKSKHLRISAHRLMMAVRARCVKVSFSAMTSLWIRSVRMKIKDMALAAAVGVDIPYNIPHDQVDHLSSCKELEDGGNEDRGGGEEGVGVDGGGDENGVGGGEGGGTWAGHAGVGAAVSSESVTLYRHRMLLQGPNKGPALLSADVDTYTSLLLEVVAKCEDASLHLKESSVTVDMLKKEKASLVAKVNRLKEESNTIYEQSQIISESYKASPVGLGSRLLSCDVSGGQKESATQLQLSTVCVPACVRSQDAVAHSTAVEQRVSLMRCVEDLYQQAVITQSAARREQEALKVATRQAALAYSKSEARVIELDERIAVLKSSRAASEEALKQYTQSTTLQDMQSNLMATIDYHDRAMTDLAEDKRRLLMLLDAALKAEEELREEINDTRKQIFSFQQNRSKVTSFLYHV